MNIYVEQKIMKVSVPLPRRCRARNWKPETENEIYVVLALFMLMGIVQKQTLECYFTKNATTATPIFNSVMSMERFQAMQKYMHFANNENQHLYRGPDKLFKIYPIVQHMNTKFHFLYTPHQNVAIDESLMLWKGRLSFKQFMPLNSSKFGFKTYESCESMSRDLWTFIILYMYIHMLGKAL